MEDADDREAVAALDRLLGGGFGVVLERWTFLKPQREKLWVLERRRSERKVVGTADLPGVLGPSLCRGMGRGDLPCWVVRSIREA